jgi:hypothetical protein
LLLSIIALTATITNATAQSDSIPSVRLSIGNASVAKDADMQLSVVVRSHSGRLLIVPKYPSWGFLLDSSGSGFFSVEVQRKVSGSFNKIKLHAIVDNVLPDRLDTLQRNDSLKSDFLLGGYFTPLQGDYRVRLLCFISSATSEIPDTYSNWVYFHCNKFVARFGEEN